MKAKLTLCAAVALVFASATAGSAQQLQYDRTGDHLASYGPVMSTGPAPSVPQHQAATHPAAHGAAQVIDRTGDHLLYYGPIQ